jgi:hypothetical protein
VRFRLLIILPFVYLAAFVVVERGLVGGPHHGLFLRIGIELVKTLALLGGLIAAWSFSRGEYLRRAWLWTVGCSALLIVSDAVLLLGYLEAPAALIGLLRGGLTIAANALQIVGLYLLAHAWQQAGLELPGSSATRRGAVVLAAALALAVAGPAVVQSAQRLQAGDFAALVGIGSGVGDIVSLTLLAPLFLSFLAFRGGRIGWVWLLLCLSGLMWLVWDAVGLYGAWLDMPPDVVELVGESCRALGCLFTLGAGLAQRWAVR